MRPNLTKGAIERMHIDVFSCDNEEFEPVLQVMHVETSPLCLSDGTHSTIAMLSPDFDEKLLAARQKLEKGLFVKLTDFKIGTLSHTQIIYIYDLEIVWDKCHLIGEPVPLIKVRQDRIAEVNLSQGAINIMYTDNIYSDKEEFKPVLQVIHMESSLLWMSDVTHSTIAMLSPDLEQEFVHPSKLSFNDQFVTFKLLLQEGSFVKLTNFKLETLTHAQIILISDLEIVLENCDLIGEPIPLLKARQDRITGVNMTQAAVARMFSDNFSFDKDFKPVLQIIQMNIHHLLVSDGLCYNTVILARNLEELVNSGRLQKDSVVKLTHFTVSLIENHKVIIIVDLDVILDKYELIGEPVKLPKNAPDLVVIPDKGELIGEPYSTTPSIYTFKTIC